MLLGASELGSESCAAKAGHRITSSAVRYARATSLHIAELAPIVQCKLFCVASIHSVDVCIGAVP